MRVEWAAHATLPLMSAACFQAQRLRSSRATEVRLWPPREHAQHACHLRLILREIGRGEPALESRLRRDKVVLQQREPAIREPGRGLNRAGHIRQAEDRVEPAPPLRQITAVFPDIETFDSPDGTAELVQRSFAGTWTVAREAGQRVLDRPDLQPVERRRAPLPELAQRVQYACTAVSRPCSGKNLIEPTSPGACARPDFRQNGRGGERD